MHVSVNADQKVFLWQGGDSGIGIPKEDRNGSFERFTGWTILSREIGGNRPGPCHHENAYPHAPGRHQGVQQARPGDDFHRAGALARYPLKQAHPDLKEGMMGRCVEVGFERKKK